MLSLDAIAALKACPVTFPVAVKLASPDIPHKTEADAVRLNVRSLDELKAELKRRFPNEPILLVHYGDHHPVATRRLLGFGAETEAEEVEIDNDSVGFITYYAIEAMNHATPALPSRRSPPRSRSIR